MTSSWCASCWPRSTRPFSSPWPTSLTEVFADGLLAGCDCVLLDLNLPATNGLDGLRAVLAVDPTAAVCVLTGLDDEHLGVAAVAAGAQDYLVKGKVDGEVLIRSVRYAVERRRAENSLLRLREEQLAAAESVRLERGLLPSPLLAGSPVRARSFYRAGRARSIIGGDFFDAVLGPTGTVHAIVGDVCGHGPDEAALGALLRVSWRALVLAGVDEPQLLPKLQQVLVSERHEERAVHHGLHGGDPAADGARRAAGPAGRAPAADPARPGAAPDRPAGRAAAGHRGRRRLGAGPGPAGRRLGAAALHRRADRGPGAASPASGCGRRACSSCWARSGTPTWNGCRPGWSSGRRR